MDNTFIDFVANKVTEKNKQFNFKPDSVLIPIHNKNNTITDTNGNSVSIVNVIANKALNELNYFYNTITPIYKNYVELITDKLVDSKTVSKLAAFHIVEVDNSFLTELGNTKMFSAEEPIKGFEGYSGTIGRPETLEEIENYFHIANSDLDGYLEHIRTQYTVEQLSDFWGKYIEYLGNISLFNNLTIDLLASYDHISLLYVVSSNLLQEKPVWCTLNNDLYFALVSRLYSNMVAIVGKFLSYKKSVLSKDRLILKIDSLKNTIYVDKARYETFLEDNTPDVILGLVVSNNYQTDLYSFNMDHLRTNKVKYEEIYKNAISLDKMSILTNQADSYKAIYTLMVEKLLKEHLTDEIKSNNKIERANVLKGVSSVLAEASVKDLLNIEKMALKIIGKVLFPNTNYYDFSKKMISYNKIMLRENPSKEADPKELAVYAITEYITEYILNQCYITKV